MKPVLRVLAALLLIALGAPTLRAADCGGAVACTVPLGRYRIALPPGELKGAYVFFHGYQSSADAQMYNADLIAAANRHGLALVLPDGIEKRWSFTHAPSADRDDIAFTGQVLDDLERRFGVKPGTIIAGGFSLGASMAWYATCAYGHRFAGVVTFAGVFWNPLPAPGDCRNGVPPMVHFHGTNDHTFPLEGRALDAVHHQGDARKSIAILREAARCGEARKAVTIGRFTCEVPTACDDGPVTLCIHDGGHEVRGPWLDDALRYLGH